MRFPVYSFAAILNELRRDAGLAVLAAAPPPTATTSGGRRPDVRALALAFGVTDELWLLLCTLAGRPARPPAGQGHRRPRPRHPPASCA